MANADGSYGRSNSAFRGELRADIKDKEDWVIIELKAGTTYTFTLEGEARPIDPNDPEDGMTNPIQDPLLALYDSKGDLIEMNDDIGLNDVGLDVEGFSSDDYSGCLRHILCERQHL